jgi:hypothetical protein
MIEDNDVQALDDAKPTWKVYQPAVDTTFLDRYNSFAYDIPGVTPGFVLAGDREYTEYKHRNFKFIARNLPWQKYTVAAIYTYLLDKKGHYKLNVDFDYREIFLLANMLSKHAEVMLVSDHGCLNGGHTENAYLGSTMTINASSVIEVQNDIVNILDATAKKRSVN